MENNKQIVFNIFVPREATASYILQEEQGAFGNFEFAFARVVSFAEILTELKN